MRTFRPTRQALLGSALALAGFLSAPAAAQDVQPRRSGVTGATAEDSRGLDSDALAELALRIHEVNDLFRKWRYDEALEKAEALYAEHPKLPPVQHVAGRAKFYMQDYEGAVALLSRAVEGSARTDGRYLDFASSSLAATRGHVSAQSENFEIRVAAGPDEILIPLALDALEKAYAEIGKDFDYYPQRRLVVESYTTAEELAAASGLPVEAIRNTGTVAVCKHNKIMFTTPRALLMGYTWLDTLSHEYVHYVVSRISDNAVPIWLHEGLAKYMETRWRGEAGLAISPFGERLLAEISSGDREIITFEQMHPSMALLPSQEHTAQAFAQVFSVVEFVAEESGGYAALRRIVAELKGGNSDRDAVEAALGKTMDAFMATWRAWLAGRPARHSEHARLEERTYAETARGRAAGSAEEELELEAGIEGDSKGDRHARLGDLLHVRSRYEAAAVQYERAYEAVGPRYPRLPNRLAATHMRVGNMERAEQVLAEALGPHPNHVTTHVLMGRLYRLTERWPQAADAYSKALHINPFDPEIHLGLRVVHEKLGDEAEAERAARSAVLLRGEEMRRSRGTARRGAPLKGTADVDESAAFLSLSSQPWARVIVDGEDTGMTTPVFRLPVEPGRRAVTLRHEATGIERTFTLELEEGETVERSFDLD